METKEFAGSLCPSAQGCAMGMLESSPCVLYQAEQDNNAAFLLGRRVPLPGREVYVWLL